MTSQHALYAAVGRRLKHFDVHVDDGVLAMRSEYDLPEGLQYLWRHANLPIVYAACSDGRPRSEGTRHALCALRVARDGGLSAHGPTITLPLRPVHITTDSQSRYVFITYPRPSAIDVFEIDGAGTIGRKVPQEQLGELRKCAHQIRLTPDDAFAILPLRGNDAANGAPEDPGSIDILRHKDGVLTPIRSIAPNDGYGFGPRHVDFHPSRPWMYASIERQNEIAMFDMASGFELRCRTTALRKPHEEKPRQLAGAVHVHPDGRTVYVSNRADGTVDHEGRQVFNDGENTIAVYRIAEDTGLPELIQTVDTQGMHVRTFQVHPDGGLLVAANMTPRCVLTEQGVREVSAGLSVFRVGEDGTLSFLRKVDLDASQDHLFWAGFVQV